jgi:hypothetical protein
MTLSGKDRFCAVPQRSSRISAKTNIPVGWWVENGGEGLECGDQSRQNSSHFEDILLALHSTQLPRPSRDRDALRGKIRRKRPTFVATKTVGVMGWPKDSQVVKLSKFGASTPVYALRRSG